MKKVAYNSTHSNKNRSFGKRSSYDSACSKKSNNNYGTGAAGTAGLWKSMEMNSYKRSSTYRIGELLSPKNWSNKAPTSPKNNLLCKA